MNRIPQRNRNRTFYCAKDGKPNSGVIDRYGRVYIVQPSGALRLIKDIVTGLLDPRRGNPV